MKGHFEKPERTTRHRPFKTFEEEGGIVPQIDDGTGVPKDALCEGGCTAEQGLHIHFHGKQCDDTICLTNPKIPHIHLPEGYSAKKVNLVVKGICEQCKG